MDCYAVECENHIGSGPLARITARAVVGFRSLVARCPRLDFEIMPDRIKRDLGFLDGRDPRYEDDLRR